MLYLLTDLRNSFDFFIRNHITFSRKNYSEKQQEYRDVLCDEEQIKFYQNLNDKYDTQIIENSTNRNFCENLYFLNVFDKYLTKKTADNISVLDIGSKNWSYVKSEYLFLKSFARDFNLTGIELDAYRMCTNFYTRYEIAKFYTKNLPNTNYVAGDFMQHNEKYNYIIWILPFIKEYPLVKWGLPLKYFKPEEMLLHAYDSLKECGELLIINQGEEEYSIQQKLNKKLNLPSEYYGEIEDIFSLFKNQRYCSKIIKNIS